MRTLAEVPRTLTAELVERLGQLADQPDGVARGDDLAAMRRAQRLEERMLRMMHHGRSLPCRWR